MMREPYNAVSLAVEKTAQLRKNLLNILHTSQAHSRPEMRRIWKNWPARHHGKLAEKSENFSLRLTESCRHTRCMKRNLCSVPCCNLVMVDRDSTFSRSGLSGTISGDQRLKPAVDSSELGMCSNIDTIFHRLILERWADDVGGSYQSLSKRSKMSSRINSSKSRYPSHVMGEANHE